MRLNKEDGGRRRFVLVSNSEATEEEPDKNLCRFVCAERVRRVVNGYSNKKDEEVPGLGGGFAYLKTRLLPRHRLDVKLEHDQVWHALQMLHDHPLSAWNGEKFCWSEHNGHGLGYAGDLQKKTISPLTANLKKHKGEVVIYTWSAERLANLLPGVTVRPIPQTLIDRFGRTRLRYRPVHHEEA